LEPTLHPPADREKKSQRTTNSRLVQDFPQTFLVRLYEPDLFLRRDGTNFLGSSDFHAVQAGHVRAKQFATGFDREITEVFLDNVS